MNPVKVLYVEDELFLGKIVRESLESRGFTVVMEEDGGQVMATFRRENPDICILDVMLPNKDGFTLADEIRELNEEVPIIFLTAKTQTEDVVRGFQLGGNDYIRKPFSVEELIARMHNLLRLRGDEPARLSGAEVPLGRFRFLPRRQLLVNDREERKLSYRETELLRLLIENRDRIIDRRDILNALWGNDSFFNSRNLDVYITRLRSYLRADDTLEIITIKGVGYRFVM